MVLTCYRFTCLCSFVVCKRCAILSLWLVLCVYVLLDRFMLATCSGLIFRAGVVLALGVPVCIRCLLLGV